MSRAHRSVWLGVLVVAGGLHLDAAASVSAEIDPDLDEWVARLTSPYRDARRRATEELGATLDLERLIEWLDHDAADVRSAAARALGEHHAAREATRTALAARLRVEGVPSVSAALSEALAQGTQPLPRPVPDAEVSPTAPWSADRLRYDGMVGSRLWRVLRERLNDGTIPGFYDGQFAEVWTEAPDAYARLLTLARDDAVHYVPRVLAVMALHELRRPTMGDDLASLILDEQLELEVGRSEFFDPRPRGRETMELRRSADLSRYARFSLAKAGKPQKVLDMIEQMDAEIESGRRLMDSRIVRRDDDFLTSEEWLREWFLALLFETGYFFQQFDDYDRASERYLQIVQRYPEARAVESAYYNLACIASIKRQTDDALRFLRRAIERGFSDAAWLLEDRDLQPLWELPEFLALVDLARVGAATPLGADWLIPLTPLLPAGRGFAELSLEEKTRVLRLGGTLLSPHQARELLGSVPNAEVTSLRRLLRDLGVAVAGEDD